MDASTENYFFIFLSNDTTGIATHTNIGIPLSKVHDSEILTKLLDEKFIRENRYRNRLLKLEVRTKAFDIAQEISEKFLINFIENMNATPKDQRLPDQEDFFNINPFELQGIAFLLVLNNVFPVPRKDSLLILWRSSPADLMKQLIHKLSPEQARFLHNILTQEIHRAFVEKIKPYLRKGREQTEAKLTFQLESLYDSTFLFPLRHQAGEQVDNPGFYFFADVQHSSWPPLLFAGDEIGVVAELRFGAYNYRASGLFHDVSIDRKTSMDKSLRTLQELKIQEQQPHIKNSGDEDRKEFEQPQP